jgi:hypothetical protein
LIFIYPGQGGIIATHTSYRMIPLDGRNAFAGFGLNLQRRMYRPLGGDTLVVDSWGFNTATWLGQFFCS